MVNVIQPLIFFISTNTSRIDKMEDTKNGLLEINFGWEIIEKVQELALFLKIIEEVPHWIV